MLKKPKQLLRLVISTLIVSGVFLYGYAVGSFEIFPDTFLQQSLQSVRALRRAATGRLVRYSVLTSHIRFTRTDFEDQINADLNGHGGGISRIGSHVVGVDAEGQFFVYEGSGRVTLLPIRAPLNKLLYLDFIHSDENRVEDDILVRMEGSLRVTDLIVIERSEDILFVVSYTHWDNERRGKTGRVATFTFPSSELQAILTGNKEVDETNWKVIFETEPFVEYSTGYHSEFSNNHDGGAVVALDTSTILVSVGDYHLDGLANPDATMDVGHSVAKMYAVDLETGEFTEFARGFRNPQALISGSDGTIWGLDHGPEGGDELNVIVRDGHYGWPYETFGTDYGEMEWPVIQTRPSGLSTIPPFHSWIPSIAPSDIIQIQDTIPEWQGDLLISTLAGQSLFRVRIRNKKVAFVEPVAINERIRRLIQLPEGTLLLFMDDGYFVELQRQ